MNALEEDDILVLVEAPVVWMAKMDCDVSRPSRIVAPSSMSCWGLVGLVAILRDAWVASASHRASLEVVHEVVHVDEVPRMKEVVDKPQSMVRTTQWSKVGEHQSLSCPCLDQDDHCFQKWPTLGSVER